MRKEESIEESDVVTKQENKKANIEEGMQGIWEV